MDRTRFGVVVVRDSESVSLSSCCTRSRTHGCLIRSGARLTRHPAIKRHKLICYVNYVSAYSPFWYCKVQESVLKTSAGFVQLVVQEKYGVPLCRMKPRVPPPVLDRGGARKEPSLTCIWSQAFSASGLNQIVVRCTLWTHGSASGGVACELPWIRRPPHFFHSTRAG